MKSINQVPREVTFFQAIKDFFTGYVEFKGRTTRAGYWWVRLVGIIISIAFLSMTISLLMYAAMDATQYYQYDNYSYEDYQAIGYNFLSTIFRYTPFFLIYGIGVLAKFIIRMQKITRCWNDWSWNSYELSYDFWAVISYGLFLLCE